MSVEKFDQWAILEIMGHQRYAGRVSEQSIGGASFVRIDVPECEPLQAFTKLFGAGSIYAITPVTEEVARAMARKLLQQPLSVYDLPDDIKQAVRTVAALANVEHTPAPVRRIEEDDVEEDEDDNWD